MKVCMQLWKQLHLHVHGDIWVCCSKPSQGQKVDFSCLEELDGQKIINNNELVKIRKMFLNGKVPRFCAKCGNLSEYESLDEFSKALLEEGIIADKTSDIDELAHLCALKELCVEFTNKCNFKCIYCFQSISSEFEIKTGEIDADIFLEVFDKLVKQTNVKQLTTIGIGEVSIVKDWTKILESIRKNYPEIKINLFSNFGKIFNESELDALSEADSLNISCDTEKAELFKQLRTGNLANVIYNITKLKYIMKRNSRKVKISIASVFNTETMYGINDFFDYLIANNFCDEYIISPMNLPMNYSKEINIFSHRKLIDEGKEDTVRQIKETDNIQGAFLGFEKYDAFINDNNRHENKGLLENLYFSSMWISVVGGCMGIIEEAIKTSNMIINAYPIEGRQMKEYELYT